MNYKSTIIVLLVFVISAAQCNRHGNHGMVLFTDGQSLFASHLPIYRSPHDYQLIYQVQSNHQDQLINHLKNGQLTILPQHFNLNTLVDGKTLTINTTIYKGHFERGGQQLFEDANFTFQKQIFKRQIANLDDSILTEKFFLIGINNNKWQLAIHAIQPRPSFDMIALFNNKTCHIQKHKNDKRLQLKMKNKDHLNQAQNLLVQCGDYEILYFETQDFK